MRIIAAAALSFLNTLPVYIKYFKKCQQANNHRIQIYKYKKHRSLLWKKVKEGYIKVAPNDIMW